GPRIFAQLLGDASFRIVDVRSVPGSQRRFQSRKLEDGIEKLRRNISRCSCVKGYMAYRGELNPFQAYPRAMTTIVAGAFMVATALVVLAFDDSHHTNLKYLMWKHHLWSYNHLSLKYLNVDPAFRMSLVGKTRAEVERWFPILQPSEKAD